MDYKKSGYRLVVTLQNREELNFLEATIVEARTQAYMTYCYKTETECAIYAKVYKARYNSKTDYETLELVDEGVHVLEPTHVARMWQRGRQLRLAVEKGLITMEQDAEALFKGIDGTEVEKYKQEEAVQRWA